MSAVRTPADGFRLRRQAGWLLVAIHIPFIVFAAATAGLGLSFVPLKQDPLLLTLTLVAGAIQLRHSLAAAAGARPRYWPWTLFILIALAFAPLSLAAERWMSLQFYVLASLAMLLRGRAALIATAVGFLVCEASLVVVYPDATPTQFVFALCYWAAILFLGAGALFAATRLVRLLDELRDARNDLADLAIGRERLRISRDLHDVLGQSLSAVSLKGDLAVGLLERGDVSRATAEIESLVSVARSALRDVRHVAHHEPPIALALEIDRAVNLLASVGTETRVNTTGERLSAATEELLAWSLREGITNVLRHSSATVCSISIAREDGAVRLAVTNDGAMPPSHGGNGLSGLAARATALSGTVTARAIGDDGFRLTVTVPVVIAT
jgi:two-component system, NarL family, sensor histidine kinase DesK